MPSAWPSGVDGGLAEEGCAGQRLERGEGDGEVGEVVLFDGAGLGDGVVGCGVGGGEVADEEWDVEPVVDADGGEDVEIVLGLVAGADEVWSPCLSDGVDWVDGRRG